MSTSNSTTQTLSEKFSACYSELLSSSSSIQSSFATCVSDQGIQQTDNLNVLWTANWPTYTTPPEIQPDNLCKLTTCFDQTGQQSCKDIAAAVNYACTSVLEENIAGFIIIPSILFICLITVTFFKHTTFGALVRKNYLLRKHRAIKSTILQLTSISLIVVLVLVINLVTSTYNRSLNAGFATFDWYIWVTIPDSSRQQFLQTLSPFLGLIFLIVFCYPIANIIIALVNEKESRMKEMLRISGMNDFTCIAAWFLTFSFKFLPLTIVIAILAYFGQLFTNTSISEQWFFYWSFIWMYVGWSMFLSAFLNTGTRIAAIGSILIAFLLYFLTFTSGLTSENTDYLGMCFIPSFCLTFGLKYMSTSSASATGVDINMGSYQPRPYECGLLMMTWGCVYAFLGWYFEYVIPQKFGFRRKPWFPFKMLWNWCRKLPTTCRNMSLKDYFSPSSYRLNKSKVYDTQRNTLQVTDEDEDKDDYTKSNSNNSNDGFGTTKIELQSLRKVYKVKGLPNNERVAVDDLSLEISKSNILILLGPNGAGKSTTFNMLTGIINPTSGDAKICGYSLKEDMSDIRKIMGFVPQVNVLYSTLSVQAHLELMCILRGKKFKLKNYVSLLEDLDMMKMINAKAKSLSGGQKRKLCLAMALVGDTKILYLDEATSGVDPESRSHFWDILKKYKQDRIVVCTTHFLDEANYLADKIAIICDGQLKAFETPVNLKTKYGDGYKLTVSSANSQVLFAEKERIDALLCSFIPTAQVFGSRMGNNKSIEYSIPYQFSKQCTAFLQAIEQQYPSFIVRFEMDDMENVFLKIVNKPVNPENMKFLGKGKYKNTNSQVLKAMLKKRWLNGKHELALWVGIFLVSVLFVSVPLMLGTIDISQYLTGADIQYSEISQYQGFVNTLMQGLVLVFCFTFIQVPAIAALVIEKELNHNVKEMQLLSGVKLWIYWLGAYLWDQVYYILFALFAFSFALGFSNSHPDCAKACGTQPNQCNNYQGCSSDGYPVGYSRIKFDDNLQFEFPVLIFSYGLLIALFVLVLPAWVYAITVKFKEHTKAIVYAIVLSTVLGIGLPLIILLMNQINVNIGNISTSIIATMFDLVFNLVPIYALMMGLCYPKIKIFNSSASDNVDYINNGCSPNVYSFPDFFQCRTWYADLFFRAAYMVVVGIGCWLYLYCHETGCGFLSCLFPCCFQTRLSDFRSHPSRIQDEEDLQQEKDRMKHSRYNNNNSNDSSDSNNVVMNKRSKGDALQLRDLTKGYNGKDLLSLEGVSFGVQSGEVFGYLGANGAGKSTTLKILTGIEKPTSGGAYIQDIHISKSKNSISEARKRLGYCSQTDNLFGNFTVEEHLQIFGMIHGYDNIDEVVDISINNMQLGDYRKVESDQLSGGNKRKLMTTLCLLGSPEVLLLDEPSSGMDPCAQRFLWNTIENVRDRSGAAIVLTSHSFPEIQALCDRIGILVEGKLRCIGPEHYLTSKFTKSYTVTTFNKSVRYVTNADNDNDDDDGFVTYNQLVAAEASSNASDNVSNGSIGVTDGDIILTNISKKNSMNKKNSRSNYGANFGLNNELISKFNARFGVDNVVVTTDSREGVTNCHIQKSDSFSQVFAFLQGLVDNGDVDLFSIIDGDLDSMFSQWIEDVASESNRHDYGLNRTSTNYSKLNINKV